MTLKVIPESFLAKENKEDTIHLLSNGFLNGYESI